MRSSSRDSIRRQFRSRGPSVSGLKSARTERPNHASRRGHSSGAFMASACSCNDSSGRARLACRRSPARVALRAPHRGHHARSRPHGARAGRRIGMAVSVLFFHRTWPHPLRQVQARHRQAHRPAAAFANPDHVSIVTHNYRWRVSRPKAIRNTTIWKGRWPKLLSSRCRRSPLPVISVARPRTEGRMPGSSRDNIQ